MRDVRSCLLILVAACGGSSSDEDGTPDDVDAPIAGVDASVDSPSMDAGPDAWSADAAIGPLTAEPSDPATTTTCATQHGRSFDAPATHELAPYWDRPSLYVTDLGGDAHPDLVGERGRFATGTGTGTFSSLMTLDSDVGFLGSARYDFNNDTHPDVLSVGPILIGPSGGLQVLLSTGTGSLVAGPVVESGDNWAASVSVADFDHDERRDVIVLERNPLDQTYSAWLYRGDGTGNLHSRTFIWGAHERATMVDADVDNDGDQDLVFHYFDGIDGDIPTREVLRGAGDGTFAMLSAVDTGAYNTSSRLLAARDFNGDGKPDLLEAGAKGGDNMLLGDGAGGFTRTNGLGALVHVPTLADFDGDGHLDIAFVGEPSANAYRVEVIYGVGDGTFTSPDVYDVTPLGIRSLSAGDIDGDGRVDLLVNGYQSRIHVLFNRCD